MEQSKKTAQENKIIELQEEIYQLRSNSQTEELELQIDSLREQLELSGKKEIKVDLIDPNPEQPRQTIPASAITVKAHSLSKHGQITPIILIAQKKQSLYTARWTTTMGGGKIFRMGNNFFSDCAYA